MKEVAKMEVKGIKKLNKTISAQLKPFGISKAECDTGYTYCYADNSVTFKIQENEPDDIHFAQFIEKRFNYKPKYMFIISLLHEVGHYQTFDDVDGGMLNFCQLEKQRIIRESENASEEKLLELEEQYFNLPDELLATYWAVEYAKNHPQEIQKMWNIAKTALFEFYQENGLLDNI